MARLVPSIRISGITTAEPNQPDCQQFAVLISRCYDPRVFLPPPSIHPHVRYIVASRGWCRGRSRVIDGAGESRASRGRILLSFSLPLPLRSPSLSFLPPLGFKLWDVSARAHGRSLANYAGFKGIGPLREETRPERGGGMEGQRRRVAFHMTLEIGRSLDEKLPVRSAISRASGRASVISDFLSLSIDSTLRYRWKHRCATIAAAEYELNR